MDNNIHLALFSLMVYMIASLSIMWKFAFKNNPLYGVQRLGRGLIIWGDNTRMHALSQVLYLYEAEKGPQK